MPSEQEPLTPTPFEPARPAQPSRNVEHSVQRAYHPAWIFAGLVTLLLVAAAVIFWLPDRVQEQVAQSGEAPFNNAPLNTDEELAPGVRPAAGDNAPQTEPWADAQEARLRLAAQDVLAELIDLQFLLEEQGVNTWAPAEAATARQAAETGDALYRERNYIEAADQYSAALEKLQALEAELPERLAGLLEATTTAIDRGDVSAAREALDLAAAIEPDDDLVATLEARLDALPEIITLLGKARQAEEADDLDTAVDALEAAVRLDPQYRAAAQALDRVSERRRDRDYQAAMSRGYRSLEAGEFVAAQNAFDAAAALKPGTAEVASARKELQGAQALASLAALQNQGGRLEKQEQWEEALAVYRKALAIDSNVVFAVEGAARSQLMMEAQSRFDTFLDEPDRLSDSRVIGEAKDFLSYARELSPRGTKFQERITALEELIEYAQSPIPVTLVSDGTTQVTLLKVARMGTFTRRELDLRPGTYVALGSRAGYRDVRVEFRVAPGAGATPISIVCTETI